ncbi:putative benzoate 4-monooxygenase cytochrome P450 [Bisporella sp. PMI_857]|nr:putative benzoate 4-monooxygenase cytochrome P450 [Bisporella sp. PMI_857]
MSFSYLLLLGISVLGVITHRCYFIYGEFHEKSPQIVKAYFLAFLGVYFAFHTLEHDAPLAAAGLIVGTYAVSLYSSIIIYRLFFHELKGIPGPTLAKITKLYHFFNALDCKQCLWMDKLHKQYGDYVRTGPNEITIFTPKAIVPIHGPNSECTRADWYDNLKPVNSIAHTRSRKVHDFRRRIWDQGFSIKALKKYEEPILYESELLESRIREQKGKPFNITKWLEYYGYDLMGLACFSKSFKMLEAGQSHWVVDTINGGMQTLGPFSGIPWFIHLVHALPFVGRPMERSKEWGRQTIRERAAVMGWILEDAESRGGLEDEIDWILGDFLVMCVGGTEPVTTTLLFLLFHLAEKPECLEKLREEIRTLTSYSDGYQLQALPYLNALIHETLRLHPGVPSGGLRITPPQGIHIDGKFIPGGTTVLTPHYSIQRREDCFVRANEFIPERWTTSPELTKDKEAFFAWSFGPYACIGKNLGLMEVRTAAVLLLDKFNFEFAPGEDGTELFKQTKDCFSWAPGPLNLVFKERTPELKVKA